MFVRIWRLVTICFVGLSMGTALAHLLEMPAKLRFDGALWLTLLQNLYPPGFGSAGSTFEAGAVLGSLALVVLVRRRHPAFGWTAFGALCMALAHGAFWLWVAPVNATLLPLSPEALPPNWDELRAQWEYTHAVRAILQTLAFGALVYSVLLETPLHAERGYASGTGAPLSRPPISRPHAPVSFRA